MNPRDVIARAMVDQEAPAGAWNGYVASYPVNQVKADAILAALDKAGYEITQRAVAENATGEPTPYVVHRLRAAIEKYGTPDYDNRVILNLDDVGRIAYRAGLEDPYSTQPATEPEPEYVVTDAMLEAAGETMHEHNWENVRKFSWITGPMRAGIEAAERVRRANP